MEGLEGASAQAGASFDRQQMEAALAALGNRVFLMNNVHDDKPVVFQTRWALSYLCGPLTRGQIKRLMDPVRGTFESTSGDKPDACGLAKPQAEGGTVRGAGKSTRPVVPAGIREKFLPVTERVPNGYALEYRPGLLGRGKVHFVRKSDDIDVWQDCHLLQTIKDTPPDDIWQGATVADKAPSAEDKPEDSAHFGELPGELSREKSYAIFTRQLKDHLYREVPLKLLRSEALDATSKPGESEANFRGRLEANRAELLAAKKAEIEKSYASKLADAETRVLKAQSKQKARFWQFMLRLGTFILVAADNIMAAFGKNMPGRRRSLNPALRSITTETGQQSTSKLDLDRELQKQKQLQDERDEKLKSVDTEFSPTGLKIEPLELKSQKGDVSADEVSLIWLPHRVNAAGVAEPVYKVE